MADCAPKFDITATGSVSIGRIQAWESCGSTNPTTAQVKSATDAAQVQLDALMANECKGECENSQQNCTAIIESRTTKTSTSESAPIPNTDPPEKVCYYHVEINQKGSCRCQ